MDNHEKRAINREKVKKHRAITNDVEAILKKRSRHELRIGNQNNQEPQLQSQSSADESMLIDIERNAGLIEESEYYEEVDPVQEQEVGNSTSEENIDEDSFTSGTSGEQANELEEDNHEDAPVRILMEQDENREVLDEAKQIRIWAISNNVGQNTLTQLLAILRTRLIPDLPKSAKTFLNTGTAIYNIQEMEAADGSIGEFVYFGIAKALSTHVQEDLHENRKILLQINVDGVPLFKSSTKQFWPILCKVHYEPDIYEPFVVAIYAGDAKPASIDEYLHNFVEEINLLFVEGIIINENQYEVEIHCFICDTPARSLIKCVKRHGGFYACERCVIRGERVDRRTVYPEVNCPKRTERSFRLQTQPEHHTHNSPLLAIEPPINLVSKFVLDFMHLFCLGVMKKLLEYWILGNNLTGSQRRNRLSVRQRTELSDLMKQLRQCIPLEFQRKPRDVNNIAKWKSNEYRFFLLYCGPVVLKRILNLDIYKHFLLFHVASRILCTSEYAFTYNAHAKKYLTSFFSTMSFFYGRHSQIINVHNLIHVADDVINMNCTLSRISAFPFESLLGKIKKLLRNANRPLAQVCRRLHEMAIISKKASIPPTIQVLKIETHQNDDEIFAIKRLKYKGFILTTKFPNNIVILDDDVIMTIRKITCSRVDRQNVQIEGNHWKIRKSIFKYPTKSEDLKMWQLVSRPSLRIIYCNINRVQRKMVLFKIRNKSPRLTNIFAILFLHD